MKFCSPYKLGVTTAIGTFCKGLNGNSEQALAEEHYQILKLQITQVFVCVLQRTSLSDHHFVSLLQLF
jgi:hypothetical protein